MPRLAAWQALVSAALAAGLPALAGQDQRDVIYWGDGLSDNPPLSLNEAAETGQPLQRNVWAADPSVRVMSNGELWMYASHDANAEDRGREGALDTEGRPEQFAITDFHMFSTTHPDQGMESRGVALSVKDVPWAEKMLWAPDVIEARDGSTRLFFPGLDHEGNFRIGMARADAPGGPFTAEPEPIGGSYSIDPNAFNEPNGSTLLFFGGLQGGQLERWRKVDEKGNALGVQVGRLNDKYTAFESPPEEVLILDEEGEPLKETDTMRRFFEGAWVHERNGTFYLIYSTGDTHRLVYATSNSTMGPYNYRGVLLNPVVGWTTHCSVVDFHDQLWLFYHDSTLSGGDTSRRTVKVGKLSFGEDGTLSAHLGSQQAASGITLAKVLGKTRKARREAGDHHNGATQDEIRALLEGSAMAASH